MLVKAEAGDEGWPLPADLLELAHRAWLQSARKIK